MKIKIFRPKRTGYIIEIKGLKYKVEIITKWWSNQVSIIINDQVIVEEQIKSLRAHLLYPIIIGSKEIVVKITYDGASYENDIYIDGISIKSGNDIDKEKRELQERVDAGLFTYLVSNRKSILKLIILMTGALIFDILLEIITEDESKFYFKYIILGVVVCFGVSAFIATGYRIVDWYSSKRKLKKWDSMYQEPRYYKS